jgi:hypothetical protein
MDILQPIFQKYSETKKIEFGLVPVRIIYESLKNDYAVIDLTEEEKNEIKQTAKKQSAQFTEGLNKFMGIKETQEERFKNSCQKMAIQKSFDKLINQKKEIR